MRKVNFEPEHKVYTYDESESPVRSKSVETSRLSQGPDDVFAPGEAIQLTNQGAARQKPTNQIAEEDSETLTMSRCKSDPGPKEEEADEAFLP